LPSLLSLFLVLDRLTSLQNNVALEEAIAIIKQQLPYYMSSLYIEVQERACYLHQVIELLEVCIFWGGWREAVRSEGRREEYHQVGEGGERRRGVEEGEVTREEARGEQKKELTRGETPERQGREKGSAESIAGNLKAAEFL
jgi:hypothetical protein